MSEMVGAVLTELTVSTNVSLPLKAPSLTITVTVALPVWLAAGVTVTVRLLPLPPKTMFALGTNVGFEELPLMVKLFAGVSASPIVKGIATVAVFTVVDWLGISLMVGPAGPLDTVVMLTLQPDVRLPWSPAPSSTTYNDQGPLADWPLNTDNAEV